MKSPLLSRLKAGVALTAIVAQLAVAAGPASAFCGFYVAQADAKLFNKSSKVVLTRNGQQTAITMASDYEGEPSEFALVIPVPSFIKKDQISVVDTKTIDHLDAYTAPRLVEYFDPDPCQDRVVALAMAPQPAPTMAQGSCTWWMGLLAGWRASCNRASLVRRLVRRRRVRWGCRRAFWRTSSPLALPSGCTRSTRRYSRTAKAHSTTRRLLRRSMQRAE